jgi:hypothetical protein
MSIMSKLRAAAAVITIVGGASLLSATPARAECLGNAWAACELALHDGRCAVTDAAWTPECELECAYWCT